MFLMPNLKSLELRLRGTITQYLSKPPDRELGLRKLYGWLTAEHKDFAMLTQNFQCLKTITHLSLQGADCQILELPFKKLRSLEVSFALRYGSYYPPEDCIVYCEENGLSLAGRPLKHLQQQLQHLTVKSIWNELHPPPPRHKESATATLLVALGIPAPKSLYSFPHRSLRMARKITAEASKIS